MCVIEAVGLIASLGAAAMWMPQAYRTVQLRRQGAPLQAINPFTYLVAMLFNVLLATYGVVNRAIPVILAGSINLVCAGVIVAATLVAPNLKQR